MRKITKAGLSVIGAAALLAGLTGPALADTGATATDFVAVGSDTVQNVANFIFDGDQAAHNGFNFSNKSTRVFTFDANGDDNGRALYNNSTPQSSIPVTAILRVGTLPVPRPNGSGAGIAALIADSVGGTGYSVNGYPSLPNGNINLVRASRLPKASENTACAAITKCGGLHVFQVAYDNLQAATSVTTNAPSGLTAVQLAHIFQCDTNYQHWNDSGIGGTSSNTIIPVIPQNGSGTHDFFLSDMGAALGLSGPITVGSCVKVGQEHDPSSIFGNATPADVIMPFSTAKIALINSGYFGSNVKNKIVSNRPAASTTAYNTARGLYFVVRDWDLANAPIYTPGGTSSLFQYLFKGTAPYLARSSTQTLIKSAGLSVAADPIQGPAFQDLGNTTAG